MRGSKTCRLNKLLDLQHSKSIEYTKKVDNAQDVIIRALSVLKKPYVSFSGGKDSLVILHLILKYSEKIHVLYVDQGMEYPDTYEYIKKIWNEWNLNLYWEYPDKSLWKLYYEGGFLNPDKPTDKNVRRHFSNTVFFGPIKSFSEKIASDGFFMGLRADESIDRKRNFKLRGFSYKKKDGLLAVQPIADWSAQDVWAYITYNDLPYNPIYDKTKFQERNKIRVAPFGLGGWHVTKGSFVFMRYYYPGLWNRFCKTNSLVRKYI